MTVWVPVTTGKSGAQVWRGPGVHRKLHDPARLADEAARLTWLGEHGIPCPAVVSLDDDGELAGLLDVDRLSVADRCRDLAVAARSIRDRPGPPAAEALLSAYGRSVDPARLAYDRLLDEFC